MTFTLHNYVLSGNCYKVRLFSALLQQEYESIAVDFHPGMEHKSESYLKLNPAGTLPILVAENLTLTDSNAILIWLARRFDGSKSWLPDTDPDVMAQVLQWVGFSSDLSATVGELRLHCMLNREIDVQKTLYAAATKFRILETRVAEQSIKGSKWLVGKHPTIADIACFPYAALSPDAGIEHDAYPSMRDWMYSIRALENFTTMPGIHALHELR